MKRTYQPKNRQKKRFTGLGRGWPQPAAEGFGCKAKNESRFQHRSSKTAFICFKVLMLAKSQRITQGRDFSSIYKSGKRLGGPFIIVYYRPGETASNRVGFVVSKKWAKQ